jgi:hypothetical protein
MRAQANLPAVTVALVVLTATAGTALVLADGAFAGATREGDERRVAVALAERMVAPGAPTTRRANVLNGSALAVLDGERLREWFPVARGVDVGVRLGDRTVVDGDGGTVARRVVLVADAQSVTRTPPLAGGETTLPRRTERVRLRIDPPSGTTVETVRANDRVVLHDPAGLDGTYTVETSRFDTVTMGFEADGPLPRGSVEVTYFPERTTKATLEVRVDA